MFSAARFSASTASLARELEEAALRDKCRVDLHCALHSFNCLQQLQPEALLLKFITDARSIKFLPGNVENMNFTVDAAIRCPELNRLGSSYPPATILD
jgi:hypothetical protein